MKDYSVLKVTKSIIQRYSIMHYYRFSLFTVFVLSFTYLNAQEPIRYKIPTTKLAVSEIVPDIKTDTIIEQNAFEVTQLITIGEYKEFLTFLAQEYDENKAISYFPDSSICFAVVDYTTYLSDTIYEKYPVLGVSWENAMSYCIWRSRKDDLMQQGFYYQLPDFTEYAAIRKKDSLSPELNLIREDYSEWSMNSKDEPSLGFTVTRKFKLYYLSYIYLGEKEDPLALKRKEILGNNFHFKRKNLFINDFRSYYQNKGYHYVGFRLIKKEIPNEADSSIYSNIIRLYDYE